MAKDMLAYAKEEIDVERLLAQVLEEAYKVRDVLENSTDEDEMIEAVEQFDGFIEETI